MERQDQTGKRRVYISHTIFFFVRSRFVNVKCFGFGFGFGFGLVFLVFAFFSLSQHEGKTNVLSPPSRVVLTGVVHMSFSMRDVDKIQLVSVTSFFMSLQISRASVEEAQNLFVFICEIAFRKVLIAVFMTCKHLCTSWRERWMDISRDQWGDSTG